MTFFKAWPTKIYNVWVKYPRYVLAQKCLGIPASFPARDPGSLGKNTTKSRPDRERKKAGGSGQKDNSSIMLEKL